MVAKFVAESRRNAQQELSYGPRSRTPLPFKPPPLLQIHWSGHGAHRLAGMMMPQLVTPISSESLDRAHPPLPGLPHVRTQGQALDLPLHEWRSLADGPSRLQAGSRQDLDTDLPESIRMASDDDDDERAGAFPIAPSSTNSSSTPKRNLVQRIALSHR